MEGLAPWSLPAGLGSFTGSMESISHEIDTQQEF